MTSFPAASRRVRNAELTDRDRLLALRECVVHFAPYGFRATWHHLIVSARIPTQLDDDLESLDRAVAELEEARLVWMAQMERFAARRRREKDAGRRTPRRVERWYSWAGRLAYCVDPEVHPVDRLAVVVQRLTDAYSSSSPDETLACFACGQPRTDSDSCPRCGVTYRSPADPLTPALRTQSEHRWRQIWRRTAWLERPR